MDKVMKKIRQFTLPNEKEIAAYNSAFPMQMEVSQEEPSQTEAALRGTAQGASYGFIDEATAGVESALGSLGLVPDKTYEQALQETQAAYDKAQKAHEWTYLGGQLAGGLATGGGVAAGALKAIKPLAQLSKYINPNTAKLAGVLGTGVIEGGLTGAGQAKPGERLEGAKEGAKGGGVLGLLVPATVGTAKVAKQKLIDPLLDTSIADAAKKTFGMGYEKGLNVFSKGTPEKIERLASAQTFKVTKKLENFIDDLSSLKESILSKQSLNKTAPKNLVQGASNILATKETLPQAGLLKKYVDHLDTYLQSPNPTASDLHKYVQQLEDAYNKVINNSTQFYDRDAANVVGKLIGDLKPLYRQTISPKRASQFIKSSSPEIQQIAQKYSQIMKSQNPVEAIDSALHNVLTGGEIIGAENAIFGDPVAKKQALVKLAKIVTGLESQSQTGRSNRQLTRDFLNKIQNADKDLYKDLKKTIEETSSIAQMQKIASGSRQVGESAPISALKNIADISRWSNVAGVMAGNVRNAMKSTGDELLGIAQKLTPQMVQSATMKYGKAFGEALQNLKNPNMDGQKAALNVILQNPDMRKALSEMFPGE